MVDVTVQMIARKPNADQRRDGLDRAIAWHADEAGLPTAKVLATAKLFAEFIAAGEQATEV